MLKVVLFVVVVALARAQVEKAIVVLNTTGVSGLVNFTQTATGVRVQGSIIGLTEGLHGFHIHGSGDLSNGCTSAGAHFNPLVKDHGAPEDEDRHVGDLGNIQSSDRNVATIDIEDRLISLNGENSIIGRAVVVHADPDDLGKGGFEDSRTTGHAGSRVVCGVIGIV